MISAKKIIKKLLNESKVQPSETNAACESCSTVIKSELGAWVRDLSTNRTVARLKNVGLEIDSVIDIGASDGRWTAEILPYFQDAQYLLVEANPFHYEALNKFTQDNKGVRYYKGAAGSKKDEICFHASDPFGGLAYEGDVSGDGIIKVQSNTVDNLVKEYNLPKKHLLKLDTHGFEVPIFEGAKETLKNTKLIIVETYCFKLHENALKFYEICKYLEDLGFSVVDFSEPLWREKDGILWQFDLFFIPSDHPTLQYPYYR